MVLKQDLDQHFMIDKGLVKRIVGYANLKKEDIVLEIGVGKGILTKELVKKCKVIAVEKDKSLLTLNDIPDAEIHYADALIFLKTKPHFNKIVANIPYSISEPLLNLLKNFNFDLAILAVGKNLADRLLGNKKTKLSILMPLFFDIELLEDVPKDAFSPKPRTSSAVIKIIPRKQLTKMEKILMDFLQQDDKLAKNALRQTLMRKYNLTKRESREAILKFDFLDKNLKLLSYKEIKKIKEYLISF